MQKQNHVVSVRLRWAMITINRHCTSFGVKSVARDVGLNLREQRRIGSSRAPINLRTPSSLFTPIHDTFFFCFANRNTALFVSLIRSTTWLLLYTFSPHRTAAAPIPAPPSICTTDTCWRPPRMTAPTQELPSWLSLSTSLATNAAGQPTATFTTLLYLPLTYYGPPVSVVSFLVRCSAGRGT